MKSDQDVVREFHKAFNRPIRNIPDVGFPHERVLRVRLILEEALEFAKACGVRVSHGVGNSALNMQDLWIGPDIPWQDRGADITQMAHELADLSYVVNGSAVQFGIPLRSCMDVIHDANMRKLGPDGKPILDAHGKVKKPDGWEPANVSHVLEDAGYVP